MWPFKSTPTIRFACVVGGYYVATPVVEAKKVFPEWMKKQILKKDVKFAKCPGMFDMAQQGYIISAWADIHIKANRQGAVIKVVSPDSPRLDAQPMDFNVVDGLAPIEESVKKVAYKCPSPWFVFTKTGYSAYVLPATLHSPFLDKLYVYSGIVDYEKFHTINFVFSPLRECDFIIPAGTPLLQVIPFQNQEFSAEYGKATVLETDKATYALNSRVANIYRKMFHIKKIFKIKGTT